MGRNTESMIKAAITETLAEELFRDLGYYVIRFGKEKIANPLTQLENYITSLGSDYKIEREDQDRISCMTYLKNLPDFILVNQIGWVDFLEVKYRHNAELWDKDFYALNVYPNTRILVVSSSVSNKAIDRLLPEYPPESKELLRNSHFHIWLRNPGQNFDFSADEGCSVFPLSEYLNYYKINQPELLEKYENLASKWLGTDGNEKHQK